MGQQKDLPDAVRVAVRIRPLLPFETAQRLGECTFVVPGTSQVAVGSGDGQKSFTFDCAFAKESPQSAVYDECVSPLVDAFFEGFNTTILAYGQTGSGKTHTMGSSSSALLSEEEQGIIPRVICNMFENIVEAGKQQSEASYSVRCQFLEIYGEEIRDLLDPIAGSVTIREGQNGDVVVHGAREDPVEDAEAMLMLLERGSLCRTTGSTLMNSSSSRSHAIFTAILEQRIGEAGSEEAELRRSKFHFVDLAGSERAKRTGAEGVRFKEGVDINKGLLTLGNVISALGDETKRGKVHVPYRDSKLTRMLQDSLGGNSQTLMICCVSPAESNIHETISALRYANRARNIQNKPIVNRDHNSALIAELKARVQMLAGELIKYQSSSGTSAESAVSMQDLQEFVVSTPSKPVAPRLMRAPSVGVLGLAPAEVAILTARVTDAEAEVCRLGEELKHARATAAQLSDELSAARAERDLANLGPHAAECLVAAAAAESTADGPVTTQTPGKKARLWPFFSKAAPSSPPTPVHGALGKDDAPVSGTKEDVKAAGMLMLRGYHEKMAELQSRLAESELQRMALERQLISNSALLGSNRTGFAASSRRSSATNLPKEMAGEVLARAEEQLSLEKKRREELLQKLNSVHAEDGSSREQFVAHVATAEEDAGVEDEHGTAQNSDDVSQEEAEAGEDPDEEEGEGVEEEEVAEESGEKAAESDEEDNLQRAAKLREKRMAMELSDIEKGIRMKEELLVALRDNEARYAAMEHHYRQKLSEMDEEVRRMEADHNHLLEELKTLEAKAETAVHADADRLRKQLTEKTQALGAARQKQQELGRLASARSADAARVKALGDEITKMKKAKIDLQKRLDAEKREQAAALLAKSREIASLKKGAQRDAAEKKKLEAQQRRAEAIGKRHLEELTMLRRLQRAKGPGRQRTSAPSGKLKRVELETKRWLKLRLKEVCRREENAAQLATEYERKLILLQKKENLELTKSSMSGRQAGSPRPMSPSASGPLPSSEDDSDVLQDVEEQLESIAAELAFKNQKISDLEVEGREYDSSGGDPEARLFSELQATTKDLPAAHSTMKVLLDSLLSAEKVNKKTSVALRVVEQQLKGTEAALEEARDRASAEVRSYDAKLTEATREFEEKIGGLITHASSASGGSSDPSGGHTQDQEAALLKLSNERSASLRANVKHLETQLADARMQCEKLEALRKAEKRQRTEREQDVQWIGFELASLRKRYSQLEEQWKELQIAYRALSSQRSPAHSELENEFMMVSNPPSLSCKSIGSGEWAEDRHLDDSMEDAKEEYDFDVPEADIAAIAEGKLPDSLAMLVDMATGEGEGGGEGSRMTVFERLAVTNTQSRALKVNKESLAHEAHRKKLLAPPGRNAWTRDPPADLRPNSVPQAAEAGVEAQSVARPLSLPPSQDGPAPNLQHRQQNIFQRLNDPQSYPVAAIQRTRQQRLRVDVEGMSSDGGYSAPSSRSPSPRPSSDSGPPDMGLVPAMRKKSSNRDLHQGRNVFDRLRRNITEAEKNRLSVMAANRSSPNTMPEQPPTADLPPASIG